MSKNKYNHSNLKSREEIGRPISKNDYQKYIVSPESKTNKSKYIERNLGNGYIEIKQKV